LSLSVLLQASLAQKVAFVWVKAGVILVGLSSGKGKGSLSMSETSFASLTRMWDQLETS